ncbi:hypothetical protein VKT23_010683 [Stygiomarasmius scandens]|uniref:F-box domain-containing protein n=1 Tax=Marasmiellus scandens TaxID=2682957 RepID=A0ABR1JB23_9AGAR
MHRVLCIPELLRIVFEFSKDASNAQCALVCKQWSEIALDVLWHDVNDLRTLFHSLSPLRKMSDHSYVFSARPTPKDWTRFETRYCSRVRRLLVEDVLAYDLRPVIKVITLIRPSRPLLPNLRELRWPEIKCWSSMNDCYALIFMHEGVHKAVFSDRGHPSADFFEIVHSRMPLLKHVEFRFCPSRKLAIPLRDCLHRLVDLESVVLPIFQDQNPLLSGLAELPALQSVKFECSGSDSDPITLKVPFSAFPLRGVENLELSISYQLAAESLKNDLLQLTSIVVRSQQVEYPQAAQSLCTALARSCPRLSKVHLLNHSFHNMNPNCPIDRLVSFNDIEPLLRCTQMTDFTLTHAYPTTITTTEISHIVLKWPHLRSITLSPSGSHQKLRSKISLRALLLFARQCPDIEEIAMRFSLFFGIPSDSTVRARPRGLPKLRTLNVGRTTVKDEAVDVALFLGEICPRGCEILWDKVQVSEQTRVGWENVRRLLPPLVERASRTRRILTENEDLLLGSAALELSVVQERLRQAEVKVVELSQELEVERSRNESFVAGESLPSHNGVEDTQEGKNRRTRV